MHSGRPTSFVDAARYLRDTEAGSYRPEWTWVHQDTSTDTVLARAVWWAPPAGEHPVALDCLWVHPSMHDPVELASQLLKQGHAALLAAGMPKLPEYLLDVPTTWRDNPAARMPLPGGSKRPLSQAWIGPSSVCDSPGPPPARCRRAAPA